MSTFISGWIICGYLTFYGSWIPNEYPNCICIILYTILSGKIFILHVVAWCPFLNIGRECLLGLFMKKLVMGCPQAFILDIFIQLLLIKGFTTLWIRRKCGGEQAPYMSSEHSFCFILFYFLLKYSWFTMLYYFQVYSKVIQLYINSFSDSFPLQVITKYWV